MSGIRPMIPRPDGRSSLRRSNSTPTKRPAFLKLRDKNANLTPSPAMSMPTVSEIPFDEHAHALFDLSNTPPPSPGHRAVFLPLRYTQTIRKRNSYTEPDNTRARETKPFIEISDKLSDREKDLEQALKWLRQEITEMKHQDRHLMRQLLELRATIRQLEGIRECQSVSANLATMVGSPLISPSDAGEITVPLQTKSVSMISVTSPTIDEEQSTPPRQRRSLDSVPPVVVLEEVGSPIDV